MRRRVAGAQPAISGEWLDAGRARQLSRQAHLIALALLDQTPRLRDPLEILGAVLPRREYAWLRLRRRRRRRFDSEHAQRLCCALQPQLGRFVAAAVGEGEQVDAALVMVESDHAIAEEQPCIRLLRAVVARGAALSAQLIAKVAGETADETEGKLWPFCAQPLQFR